ncbi:MAG: hypothetical protein ACRDVD_01355, partial [Acidimicrobiia bacterium]
CERGCPMMRIIHAELGRLVRRRTLIGSAIGAVIFSLIAGYAIFATADGAGEVSRRGGTTLTALTDAGGGTEAFAAAASFAGFLVFVIVIALVATEFSAGTFRALLLRSPGRVRVIGGKLVAFLIVAAGFLALSEIATFVVSWALAPGQDIATNAWFSFEGLAAAASDFGTVFAGVTGWAVFGTTLAAIFRSAPLALGIGFAWAGPFENIVVESWSPGFRWFPGQVLGSLIRGGTLELAFSRAVLTTLAYTAIALAATLVLVSRRDVTS